MGAVAAEMQACGHRDNIFYLQHAMGLASSVGLGIALSRPDVPVVVFDGDGSVLMNLGGLTTLGRYRPPNLIHVVFDNESLLSVGGFPTATGAGTSLAAVAAASGVPHTAEVRTLDAFVAAFDEASPRRRADDDRRQGRRRRAGGLRHRPGPAREPLPVPALPGHPLRRGPGRARQRAGAFMSLPALRAAIAVVSEVRLSASGACGKARSAWLSAVL